MKIGIITMHKVLNYGSALQAFATQQVLASLGYDSEIIDYEYKKPKEKEIISIKRRIIQAIVYVRDLLRGFPQERKRQNFNLFYTHYFTLTKDYYTATSIVANPPLFDVYMSGSDQVWNPRFAGNDVNFMLAFAPEDKPKIAFASSFATDVIDDAHKKLYSPQLSRYNAISVREQSGIEIIKTLTGKDAVVCCDPTLLLNQEVVSKLSIQSSLKLKYRFLLVYGLHYMFDPYPYLYNIINYVSEQMKCRVVYLDGRNADLFKRNAKVVSSAGPCEFLWLFEHAEFVITTSFHGTAFSLIYDKPFYSVVDKDSKTDSRISSLCKLVNAEHSLIDYREKPNVNDLELRQLKGDNLALDTLREDALTYLKKILSKFEK